MAIKSTVYKATLNISDMDRHYYAEHNLTIARHPSETEERMMVRVLAFALNAHELLEFGKGISADDEPALWRKDYTGIIEQWIEVGLPDEKLLRRASGRAGEVIVLSYSETQATVWWAKDGRDMQRIDNLRVYLLPDDQAQALTAMAARGMQLQCTIQDGDVWITNGDQTVQIKLTELTTHP
ncbi:MAG TPA: YaeQ family protein [Rhodocyclaceae bacterium]|jgi:uncharacterized protein YaeQ|nr:YaeQ family protein [Rhodocyclaceae bacterium]